MNLVVREQLRRAYEGRDLRGLSQALRVALAAPDRSLTPVLCDIASEREWLHGCQEMALEVLIDLADPAAYEALLRLCTHPSLELNDGIDWRKAVFAITALPIEKGRIETALEAIARSGNGLKGEAADALQALKR